MYYIQSQNGFDCKNSSTARPPSKFQVFRPRFVPSLLHSVPLVSAMSASDISHDKEKGSTVHDLPVHNAEVAPDDVLIKRYGRLGPLLSKLFASGVEARGVERVPEDQRDTKNMWNK